MSTKPSNRLALVLGAGGGIGSSICQRLADQGTRLILVGRTPGSIEPHINPGESSAAQLLYGDLNDDMFREHLLGLVRAQQPDLILNAIGAEAFGLLGRLSSEQISRAIQTNLTSTILWMQGLVKALDPTKPCRVIQVGSTFSAIGYPGYTVYCATKFGVEGFLEALRRELLLTKIEISSFHPRATDTPFNTALANQLNTLTGETVDSAQEVADAFMAFLKRKKLPVEYQVGRPQRFFRLLNRVVPRLVDQAIEKQLPAMLKLLG
jgi:short-subunit dehydrogenase